MNDIAIGIISATFVILLLIGGVAIALFRSQRQKMLHEKQLADTKYAFEAGLRQIEAEEKEKLMQWLAHELHDNIGQLLTAMHWQIQSQKISAPQNAESYRPLEIYVSEVSRELRLLSKTLNQDHLLAYGLESSLRTEIERLKSLNRFEIAENISFAGSPFARETELIVFRIFQETLQNALRHSEADRIFITVVASAAGFFMEVRDNGKGFDYDELLQAGRISGLKNIEHRAGLLGLKYEISSETDKGTSVILKK
jgi:two-component system, NarL family, sensor kinase